MKKRSFASVLSAWLLVCALLLCSIPAAFAAGVPEEENVPALPCVVQDNAVCRFAVISATPSNSSNYTWTVQIQNKTDHEITVTLTDCAINEISCIAVFSVIVPAKESLTTEVPWFTTYLLTPNLNAPSQVEFNLTVVDNVETQALQQKTAEIEQQVAELQKKVDAGEYDATSAEQLAADMLAQLVSAADQAVVSNERHVVYPYGQENARSDKHVPSASDQVLTDDGRVRFSVTQIDSFSLLGSKSYTVTLYVENNTNQSIWVDGLWTWDGMPTDTTGDFSIPGCTVSPGKGTYIRYLLPIGRTKTSTVRLEYSLSGLDYPSVVKTAVINL